MQKRSIPVANSMYLFSICAFFLVSTTLTAAETDCSKGFYTEVTTELDKAYIMIGRPATSRDNLRIIKDVAVSQLESHAGERPKGSAFTITSDDDGLAITATCSGKETKGIWKSAR